MKFEPPEGYQIITDTAQLPRRGDIYLNAFGNWVPSKSYFRPIGTWTVYARPIPKAARKKEGGNPVGGSRSAPVEGSKPSPSIFISDDSPFAGTPLVIHDIIIIDPRPKAARRKGT